MILRHHPDVGFIADHKSGQLDPRTVSAVSDDGTRIKILIHEHETDWLDADNYEFFEGDY